MTLRPTNSSNETRISRQSAGLLHWGVREDRDKMVLFRRYTDVTPEAALYPDGSARDVLLGFPADQELKEMHTSLLWQETSI